MHSKRIVKAGKDLKEADNALIMVHGRGGSAGDILSLAEHLPVGDFALLAPQATGNSWYPQSFLAPPQANEPWLTSALAILESTVADIRAEGIAMERIYLLGFSQGACLTLEFVARHATKYGGVVAFTGGLIGDKLYPENYKGDFHGTRVFIGTGDPDPHVPVPRVHATTAVLTSLNAAVTEKIYPGMGHTISSDEIRQASRLVWPPA
jgi:phospholipase/carboxylesterase